MGILKPGERRLAFLECHFFLFYIEHLRASKLACGVDFIGEKKKKSGSAESIADPS